MAWISSQDWGGLPTGLDGFQFLLFNGMDAPTGYIHYQTAPISKGFAIGRQLLKLGGERYSVHIFCGDHQVFDAVSAVINNHPDAQKKYEWTLKGPTWFNTNKLIMCHKVDEMIVECEREFCRRGYGSGRLEVRVVESVNDEERHCFVSLRRSGVDFEEPRYWAISEFQENVVHKTKKLSWPALQDYVRRNFHSAGLLA